MYVTLEQEACDITAHKTQISNLESNFRALFIIINFLKVDNLWIAENFIVYGFS